MKGGALKKYLTLEKVSLFSGVVGLSKKQAEPRLRIKALESRPGGLYKILSPIQFKAGEIIGLDSPDKAVLAQIELTPAEKAKADKAEAEAEAEAEAKAETPESKKEKTGPKKQ